jgi:hypothetical protein
MRNPTTKYTGRFLTVLWRGSDDVVNNLNGKDETETAWFTMKILNTHEISQGHKQALGAQRDHLGTLAAEVAVEAAAAAAASASVSLFVSVCFCLFLFVS